MSDGGGENEVLNPVVLEQRIGHLSNQIAKGVAVVSAAEKQKLDADRIYDGAFATAYLTHPGPAHEKKYAAEKVTQQERLNRDVAFVAFRHAERQMKALETQLSSAQSVLKSVLQMYGAAGSGRGQ